jgi:antitoxin component of MazEF toxin-antitoxin module
MKWGGSPGIAFAAKIFKTMYGLTPGDKVEVEYLHDSIVIKKAGE